MIITNYLWEVVVNMIPNTGKIFSVNSDLSEKGGGGFSNKKSSLRGKIDFTENLGFAEKKVEYKSCR